jgi:hypothetical protein
MLRLGELNFESGCQQKSQARCGGTLYAHSAISASSLAEEPQWHGSAKGR